MISDPLSALLDVVQILDDLRLPYAIGGSVASSVFGEPRASADADLIVEISEAQLSTLVARLEGARVDAGTGIGRTVTRARTRAQQSCQRQAGDH